MDAISQLLRESSPHINGLYQLLVVKIPTLVRFRQPNAVVRKYVAIV